jgi:hypothetical protein
LPAYRSAGDQILNANQFSKKDKVIMKGAKERDNIRTISEDKDNGAPLMLFRSMRISGAKQTPWLQVCKQNVRNERPRLVSEF